ncbi:MAG: putative lipid II flippase FtsW [Nevskiales bacterium]|nr:putative lipid II flippase FtsW [Nevskiales bacterium]
MTALPLKSGMFPWQVRHGLDGVLLGVALALLACGLVMVASASVAVAEKSTGVPLYYFYKQFSFAGLGLMLAALVFAVPMKSWETSGFWLLAFAFFLLMLVLIPGIGLKVNNARRWLDLGLFRLQASEPARLALVIYLVGYVVRRQAELQNSFRGLLKPLLPVALASVLLLLEPDFGAAALLLAVTFLLLFLAGTSVLHLGVLLVGALGVFALLVVSAAYRLRRLLSFTDPWADIENGGWQLTQSLIAIGRGEWTGVGLGNSVQKLLYLPETHTDFIFAIWSEEFGLFGIVALLVLFGIVVWRTFKVGYAAERLQRLFRAYLCYTLGAWLGLQALINMAVVMGLLPTKGLTLPLISYGGSSLVTVCLMLALILRVDHENRLERAGAPAGGIRWA